MVELLDDGLVFSFPEIHAKAKLTIDFQRTLRIPDDNRDYPLPPGLGQFPLVHVADHASKVPSNWGKHGGVLLPMYQSEAMWINFSSSSDYPFAIKIAAGKINAVTGDAWTDALSPSCQDYIVVPEQPWLDGFCIQKGLVRQFVAMPLGDGFTAEEQISGRAEHGGIQIIVYPMRRSVFDRLPKKLSALSFDDFCDYSTVTHSEMGLAPGGLMHQEIFQDPHGYSAWEETNSRCYVHILNSLEWQACTGGNPPTNPISASEYTDAGLPWFEFYSDSKSLDGAKKLATLDSVSAVSIKQGKPPIHGNEAISTMNIVALKKNEVTDGKW